MDLRKYYPSTKHIKELKRHLSGYQPFVIDDNCQTGIAAKWIYGYDRTIVEKDKVAAPLWNKFIEINARMRRMYDDWIESICSFAGSLSSLSVVDIACNDGYFLFRFLEKGARDARGYERDGTRGKAINLLNNMTGLPTSFVNEAYSSTTHTISGVDKADIVIASAIMLHLSDPLYFLNFLASISKKLVFVFTAIDDHSDLRITYHADVRKYYSHDPFPICFDCRTAISRPLFELGVRELGFKKIIQLEHKKNWLPKRWYKKYKTFILLK